MKHEETTTTLLKGSIEVETLKNHLSNMLDEWEAQYASGTIYSYESKEQYIRAAKFMRDHGRKFSSSIIESIEKSLD